MTGLFRFDVPPVPFYEAGLVKRVMASRFYPGCHAGTMACGMGPFNNATPPHSWRQTWGRTALVYEASRAQRLCHLLAVEHHLCLIHVRVSTVTKPFARMRRVSRSSVQHAMFLINRRRQPKR